MNKTFDLICPVCGKGKGGAFRGINHAKCSKVLQEIMSAKKNKQTTRRMTERGVDFLAGFGK